METTFRKPHTWISDTQSMRGDFVVAYALMCIYFAIGGRGICMTV